MKNISMTLEGSVAERWPRGAERSRPPLIPSPRFVPQKPTTGLLAITLALHLCDLVHIAGFGYPDAHHKKQSIHYYEYITLKSMVVSGPCWGTGWGGPAWGHGVSEDGPRGSSPCGHTESQIWNQGIWAPRPASPVFCLPSESRHGERSSRGVGLRGGPGSCLGVPQLASLAVSTVVRPQCLPGGPGHQADAGNRSRQEPHVLLTGQELFPSACSPCRVPPSVAVGGARCQPGLSLRCVGRRPGLRRGCVPGCSGGGQIESGWRP